MRFLGDDISLDPTARIRACCRLYDLDRGQTVAHTGRIGKKAAGNEGVDFEAAGF